MATVDLVPVVRPNGAVYRPRNLPRVTGATDDDETHWVYVLRSHDIELARTLARPFRCSYVVDPQRIWLRATIRNGEPYYDHTDGNRGTPAVMFRESDDPEEIGE